MPEATSADPAALFEFARFTSDLGTRLVNEGRAVGACLERVASGCGDQVGHVAPVDRDLLDLARLTGQMVELATDVATRFESADVGLVQPGRSGTRGPVDPADAPAAELPSWLLVALRAAAGLGAGDLTDLGHRLLGSVPGGETGLGVATTVATVLTPASGWVELITGGALAKHLAGLPGVENLLTKLHLGGAGPAVSHTGHSLTALSLTEDIKRLVDDGNPAEAWRREGAGYLAHWARLGFDGTSAACSREPSVAVCSAAAVTGLAWGGLEIYEHREPIGRALSRTAQAAKWTAGRVRSLLFAGRSVADPGRRLLGVDVLRRPPGLLPPSVTPLVRRATDEAGRVAVAAQHRVGELGRAAGALWHRGWKLAIG